MASLIKQVPALVNCSWLKLRVPGLVSHLEKWGLFENHGDSHHYSNETHRNKLRLLDVSTVIGEPEQGLKGHYRQGHIPGALHFDLGHLAPMDANPQVMFPLPCGGEFRDYIQSFGITNDTHLVVYDSAHPRNSVRTWFLFRVFGHNNVSMLDGGFNKWQMDGNPVTNIPVNTSRNHSLLKLNRALPPFQIEFKSDILVEYNEMEEIVENKSAQIIDVRVPEAFQKDHIPGAVNIPFTTLFASDGTFKSAEDLREILINNGVYPTHRTVAYCNGGLMACGMAAAGHIMGARDVAVYNGSWREWSQRKGRSAEGTDGEQCCNSQVIYNK